MIAFSPIEPARLDWRDGAPYSPRYGDIFFDRDDALAEVRYVFLEGNDLPQRWRGRERFVIAETGFGTGLNFLVTLKAWRDSARDAARLHYLAVEKHPLVHDDLAKALSPWPSLAPGAQALLAVYPQLVGGFHRLSLMQGRVSLTLMLGDAASMLAQLRARVDAWYLDGFAPSKNADMWSEAVFRQMARLSARGATFGTFTAAGGVRRGLAEAGFDVAKRSGFGRKREMLRGRFQGGVDVASPQPWFALAQADERPVQRRAIVIGAGLAGCCVAHALAARGWSVDVVDRHERVAREASGNPAGVVMPRLTADMNPEGRFYLSAFLHVSRWLDGLRGLGGDVGWRRSGVLQLADAGLIDRLTALAMPADVVCGLDEYGARQRSGVTVQGGGVHFPLGGWLVPPALCAYLLRCFADRIKFVAARDAIGLRYDEGVWSVNDSRGEIGAAPVVVLAGGSSTVEHVAGLFALQAVRGQLTYVEATPVSRRLALPVCYDGYVLPELNGQHCIGATFNRDSDARELNSDDDRRNTAALSKCVTGLGVVNVVGGRVSFRASTLDHLPVCGPVPDVAYYTQHYAALRHGARARHFPVAVYRPGLYVTTGHGARGLVSCPMSAHVLAALVEGEPLPMPADMLSLLHPGRFLVRALKRGGG